MPGTGLRSQHEDMNPRRLALAAALVPALVLGTNLTPAGAETRARADRAGDAPTAIDATSATYTHGPRRVSVVATIPALGDRGSAALSISKFDIFEAGYVVQIRKRVGQEPRTRLTFFNHFDLQPRRCPGVRGTWSDDVVRLSVPRSCLTGHRAERLFVQFGIQRGADVDRVPAIRNLPRG